MDNALIVYTVLSLGFTEGAKPLVKSDYQVVHSCIADEEFFFFSSLTIPEKLLQFCRKDQLERPIFFLFLTGHPAYPNFVLNEDGIFRWRRQEVSCFYMVTRGTSLFSVTWPLKVILGSSFYKHSSNLIRSPAFSVKLTIFSS